MEGRVALVTGSGQGIGQATAKLLGARGAKVVLNDIEGERLEESRRELAAMGMQVEAFLADVTSDDAVEQLFDSAVRAFGSVDVLVNNVGTSWGPTGTELTVDRWSSILEVNLTS